MAYRGLLELLTLLDESEGLRESTIGTLLPLLTLPSPFSRCGGTENGPTGTV